MYDFSEFRRRQFSLRRVSQPWKEEDFENINMKVFFIKSIFSEVRSDSIFLKSKEKKFHYANSKRQSVAVVWYGSVPYSTHIG